MNFFLPIYRQFYLPVALLPLLQDFPHSSSFFFPSASLFTHTTGFILFFGRSSFFSSEGLHIISGAYDNLPPQQPSRLRVLDQTSLPPSHLFVGPQLQDRFFSFKVSSPNYCSWIHTPIRLANTDPHPRLATTCTSTRKLVDQHECYTVHCQRFWCTWSRSS